MIFSKKYKVGKIILSTLLSLFIMLEISACSNPFNNTGNFLSNNDRLIRDMENYYPNTEFITSETKEMKIATYSDTVVEVTMYTFRNNDFEYTVYSYIEDGIFGNRNKKISTNYYEKVYAHIKDDIDRVIENSPIPTILDQSYMDNNYRQYGNYKEVEKFQQIGSERCIIKIPQPSLNNSMFYFKFQVDDIHDIENCMEFLRNFYQVLLPYIPKAQNKTFVDTICVEFTGTYFPNGSTYMSYAESFYKTSAMPFVIDGFSFENILTDAKREYISH